MLLRMTIKPGVYQKLRGLYGKHVDKVDMQSRLVRQTVSYEYRAECAEHGEICGWTRDSMERAIRVRDHLKGTR